MEDKLIAAGIKNTAAPKYKCSDCGWQGDVLGDKMTDDGDVECCMNCDGDNIEVTPNV